MNGVMNVEGGVKMCDMRAGKYLRGVGLGDDDDFCDGREISVGSVWGKGNEETVSSPEWEVYDKRRFGSWGDGSLSGLFEVSLGSAAEQADGDYDVYKLHIRMEGGGVLGEAQEVAVNGCFVLRRREEESDDEDEVTFKVEKGMKIAT